MTEILRDYIYMYLVDASVSVTESNIFDVAFSDDYYLEINTMLEDKCQNPLINYKTIAGL